MATGQYIPKIAALQASPIVDPDTGMATPMLMMHIQAIMDRIGGSSNLPLPTYVNPAVANSASGISGIAPSLTVGSATTATTATNAGAASSATNLTGTPQPNALSWTLAQDFLSGFSVGEATNGKQGTATLVAGTKVVANTSVTATSRIFLSRQALNASTAVGHLSVSARAPGVSFTISSFVDATVGVQAGDLSTVAYLLSEVG